MLVSDWLRFKILEKVFLDGKFNFTISGRVASFVTPMVKVVINSNIKSMEVTFLPLYCHG